MIRSTLTIALICMASAASLAEDPDFSAELPRIPPTPPEKAIDTFVVKEGYKIELAAAEPLVASPVAICWDERGRMFVVEMRGYSEHRDEKLSRVRVLEDDNNDGVYDRSTIFAADLLWPTAIACWDGGVFVADAPDILYLKDTDGDGQADVRKRVFTGFGVQNVQGLLNSFHWGLDNRIQGSSSSNGGSITVVDKPDVKPIVVNGRDFSFDPRTLDFRPESGGAQHGMTFDDYGHKFVCSNSDHCQQVMFEDRYVARNPLLAAPSTRVSIATDGPQAEVFRSSPVEPWRVVRTRLRVAGAVPGPIEGGGRAAGYFTGATGVTMVRGSAFAGDPMYGMVVVGDVGSNLIHRKKLTLEGVQYKAERIDKESEFVASKDNWFRPAQFANGPDGALYVIDVYREVIEHPASLPPAIKKHLDLDSGRDRGRIWRISPKEWQRTKVSRLDELKPPELVARLSSKNAWDRETAARLIYQRQPHEAIGQLEAIARSHNAAPAARIQAMYTLAGLAQTTLGALDAELVAIGLQDSEPRVREHAARLARLQRPTLPIRLAMESLVEDKDAQVRYQLAFALGDAPQSESDVAGVAKLLSESADDKWLRFACLTSLPDPYGALGHALSSESKELTAIEPVLPELAILAGRTKNGEALAKTLPQLAKLPNDKALLRISVLRGLMTGAGMSREELLKIGDKTLLAASAADALSISADTSRPTGDRAQAMQGLVLGEFAEAKEFLAGMLSPQQPKELQLAATKTLESFATEGVGELLVTTWQTLAPETRRAALDVLVSRPERAKQLLQAIADRDIQAAEVDAAHIDLLKKHANAEVREQATKLFAASALARRADVVEQYRPLLEKPGDAVRGKELFAKNCSSCHKVEGIGHELAPNLAAMKNRGPEAILLNVLDPNREVNPQYLSYVVVTNEGRTLSGIIAAESATSITLKRADGQGDEVLRSDIDELRSTGLSLMPEGLEKLLDQAAMADLIAYILTLK